MTTLLPSDFGAVVRKLEHVRDGARRIQNGNNCEPDRNARVIATNIANAAQGALVILRDAEAGRR